MNYHLEHFIPGRMRLRVPALKHSRFAHRNFIARLRSEPGVLSVRVNPYASAVVVEYDKTRPQIGDDTRALVRTLVARDFRGKQAAAQQQELAPSNLVWLGASTAALIAAAAGSAAGIPLLLISGIPTFKRAYRVLTRDKRLNVDALDTIVIGSAALGSEILSGVVVSFLVNLGEWIRDFTMSRSRKSMNDILRFQNRRAWVLRDGRIIELPVDGINCGDTVIVHIGESIPADGVVIRSHGLVDQKTITGESAPIEKRPGDAVFAGTTLLNGKLYITAKNVSGGTVVAGIVRFVESAPIGETRMQNYAEKFADRLVAPFLALAGGLYGFTGDTGRFLSMLIVDYGTGMRVAAPTAMLACMLQAAQRGILVKSGAHLERLARVDTILFDKTGTLTHGSPQIVDVHSLAPRMFPSDAILRIAATAEAGYSHPIAEAVVSQARSRGIESPEHVPSRYQVGSGVEARINGFFVQIGSERFMKIRKVRTQHALDKARRFERDGCSSLLVAVNGEVVGLIAYADQLRPEIPGVIRALRLERRFELVMVTGDREPIARRVASKLGFDRYFSEALPRNKVEIIEEYQRKGRVVAMVGDGINDSPAISRADVGISLRNGSDLTQDTARIVLMKEDMWKLISALQISRDAVRLIEQNWKIVALLNTLTLLAVLPGGLIAPSLAASLSNGSSILAILNGLRPLMNR